MVKVRRAHIEEAEHLSNLAFRSKAYWGYDASFMEACREALTITKNDIVHHPIFVLEEHNRLVGFYSLKALNDDVQLDFFFIDPAYIGKGYGKRLWEHLIATAKELGITRFTIDSDPFAEEFYKKMGAIRIGEVPSTVFADRKLPLLEVRLKSVETDD